MTTSLVGVVLAGGLASRMGGGDKGLRTVGGRAILERVVERVRPQVDRMILNANGDAARFRSLPYLAGLPVVADDVPGYAGPLAGILAALDWAAAEVPTATDILSVAADSPFVPRDLADRMLQARGAAGAVLACARSGRQPDGDWQTHPVIGIWPLSLRQDLRAALLDEGLRKIDRWTARHPLAYADFAIDPVDPFFNANTPEELAEADRVATAHPDL